jgi:hypothetical protein
MLYLVLSSLSQQTVCVETLRHFMQHEWRVVLLSTTQPGRYRLMHVARLREEGS